MRLDKFLKCVRVIKRRTVANELCDLGLVSLNGKVARASAEVRVGDIIEGRIVNRRFKLQVIEVPKHELPSAKIPLYVQVETYYQATLEGSSVSPEALLEDGER
ncbi:MAG: RNA-binding S4 domain-containing protein [Vampirovibrionales bacterium]